MLEETPTIDAQVAVLLSKGWKRVNSYIWKSPTGVLFLGPHGAWKVATGKGKRRQAREPGAEDGCRSGGRDSRGVAMTEHLGPKRDPRVDPKAGDMLSGWGRTIGNIEITDRLCEGLRERVVFNSWRCRRSESLIYFQRMAKNAEVIHAAE